ncbi:MAG TPA: hypothetical protein VJU78_18075, partial [Chitinophagaceae bacterium]|nr:hypothetical protein [Chitinophagaceae bacterium]
MKKVKVSTVFFLILFFTTCRNSEKESVYKTYGVNYNHIRKKIGIPSVSEKMKFVEDIKGERYLFSYRNKSDSLSRHMWKVLLVDSLL